MLFGNGGDDAHAMMFYGQEPGGWLIIKMSSPQNRDPHVYLIFNIGIPIPGKDGLYI